MISLLYLVVIVLSNVLTARIDPMVLFNGYTIIPAGTWLLGVTFFLRDFIQIKVGKRRTYYVIVIALLVSAVCSVLLGDTLFVTIASAVAFAFSETIDTEIFSRVRKSILVRILLSGVIAGMFDSSIFVLIGLSPLFTGILDWGQVPFAILGQVVVKAVIQGLALRFVKTN